MKYIRNIAIIVGMVLIYGTMGSVEIKAISDAQANIQMLISFVILGVGWLCHRVIVHRQIVRKRRRQVRKVKERYYA